MNWDLRKKAMQTLTIELKGDNALKDLQDFQNTQCLGTIDKVNTFNKSEQAN